ncbi:MAG TPA: WYL domain-containing protein [Eubacterium sp.]|nr:WYL domain-containing protein [Eubacterium sp.]
MTKESKSLALIRVLDILKDYTDCDHPLTQEMILEKLDDQYGICVERKTIGRCISLLKEAGFDIQSGRKGCYMFCRDFEDAELNMLIDGVLCSKYIPANQSEDLIKRICRLSNKHFRSHIKHIRSVNELDKTDNQALFINIEKIDEAIEKKCVISYNYNKYGVDKKLHKSEHSPFEVSPYCMLIHNQRYYLMAYHEKWNSMVFHRLDRITELELLEADAYPLKKVSGYEKGIDYEKLSGARPYMYSDEPEHVVLIADVKIIDQIIDWFGKGIDISKPDEEAMVKISMDVSLLAMKYWALQYVDSVEVVEPVKLRESIVESLNKGLEKYNSHNFHTY